MTCVYILKSLRDGRFYIGSTRNFADRLNRHLNGCSKATKSRLPMIVVYKKEFPSYGESYKFEQWLKAQKSKKFIERLISTEASQ